MALTAKQVLEQFMTTGKTAAHELLQQSEALGKSAVTSIELTARAGKDLISGKLDQEGAELVAKNAFNHLKQLAMAQGNLTASALVDWLTGMAKLVLQLIPGLPKA